jgi:hypothetical protein
MQKNSEKMQKNSKKFQIQACSLCEDAQEGAVLATLVVSESAPRTFVGSLC